jgi:hypothetical protein
LVGFRCCKDTKEKDSQPHTGVSEYIENVATSEKESFSKERNSTFFANFANINV